MAKKCSKRARESNLQLARAERDLSCQRETRRDDRQVELDHFYHMCEEKLCNRKGCTCTSEENCMVLSSMKMAMQLWQELTSENGPWDPLNWTWSVFDEEMACSLRMKKTHVAALCHNFAETGEVLNFGNDDEKADHARGQKKKLTPEQMQFIVDHEDQEHALDCTVNNKLLRAAPLDKCQLKISKMTMFRCIERLGLSWKKAKSTKRTYADYGKDAMRTFLIKFSQCRVREREGQIAFVFTDESYVHQTHCQRNACLTKDSLGANRKAGKGRRLVILHAITEHGPLCERLNGIPVDDLAWNGNTPHPTNREDGLITCETLWLANSSEGDCHDNMDSDNFMRWVESRLVPTFERLHPGEQMALIADNAPHHHKRVIGSLNGLSKKKLIELCGAQSGAFGPSFHM